MTSIHVPSLLWGTCADIVFFMRRRWHDHIHMRNIWYGWMTCSAEWWWWCPLCSLTKPNCSLNNRLLYAFEIIPKWRARSVATKQGQLRPAECPLEAQVRHSAYIAHCQGSCGIVSLDLSEPFIMRYLTIGSGHRRAYPFWDHVAGSPCKLISLDWHLWHRSCMSVAETCKTRLQRVIMVINKKGNTKLRGRSNAQKMMVCVSMCIARYLRRK